MITNIFGYLATTASLTLVFCGLPMQIVKNYKSKSTQELSTFFFTISFFSYICWCLYGIAKGDWFLIVPGFAGIPLAFTILFQIWYYRKK